MKTVLRYEIYRPFPPENEDDVLYVGMPVGARICTLDVTENHLYLWAQVEPDAPLEKRGFVVIATGVPLPMSVHDDGEGRIERFWFLRTAIDSHAFEAVHVYEAIAAESPPRLSVVE